MSKPARPPTYRWTTAAVAVVALAVLLAGFGLYFAINHTRLQYRLSIAALRDQAVRLRHRATDEINLAVRNTLKRAAQAKRDRRNPGAAFWSRTPEWITHVLVWDGRILTVSPHPRAADLPPITPETRDMIKRGLQLRLLDLSPITPPAVEFARPETPQGPFPLAFEIRFASGANPFIVAVHFDLDRLKDRFLVPLFQESGIGVIRADPSVAADVGSGRVVWTEPIASAFSPLVLTPSAEFLATEKRNLYLRIAAYVLVTTLFVAALTATIIKFFRLVNREMALSRMKSNFVADVSHELKTPLALIRMFSEMLSENRVSSEQKRKQYYDIIMRESARLTQMIENILDFARIESGKKAFTFGPTDIARVVRDTYDAYRFELDRSGFDHRLVLPDDLPTITADADALAQALVNLISNALKYADDEKELIIELETETRRGKQGVLVSVSDRGIGIKPEDRAHLFDGFFRADDDRVRRKRGAGLGLSLVKSIVEAHGGGIDVESRLVKGTTFRLFLPRQGPGAEVNQPPRAETDTGNGHNH